MNSSLAATEAAAAAAAKSPDIPAIVGEANNPYLTGHIAVDGRWQLVRWFPRTLAEEESLFVSAVIPLVSCKKHLLFQHAVPLVGDDGVSRLWAQQHHH